MKKFILVALLMVSNVYSQNYAPNSGDISLKCSKEREFTDREDRNWKKSEAAWRERLWIINVDAGYVVEMLDVQWRGGRYWTRQTYGNKKIGDTPEKYQISSESDLRAIKWRIYHPYELVETNYNLNRETLNLRGHKVRTSEEYSCEIITRQELDEIKLKRLKEKSASLKAALEADRIKKEKEDAEQRKKNKL